MELEFLGLRKVSNQKYFLDFNFLCQKEKYFFQIGYSKKNNAYSYNCKVFGEFIMYYRHHLKKQGKTYNPKLNLEGFKAYGSFLKQYIKQVHPHNFWFVNALKTRQNLEKELSFIEELIIFLSKNEALLKKQIKL